MSMIFGSATLNMCQQSQEWRKPQPKPVIVYESHMKHSTYSETCIELGKVSQSLGIVVPERHIPIPGITNNGWFGLQQW